MCAVDAIFHAIGIYILQNLFSCGCFLSFLHRIIGIEMSETF
jgi:hypothetical protein